MPVLYSVGSVHSFSDPDANNHQSRKEKERMIKEKKKKKKQKKKKHEKKEHKKEMKKRRSHEQKSTRRDVLCVSEDLPLLRTAAPELMSWVEDKITVDKMCQLIPCAVLGASDVVYYHRCVAWLAQHVMTGDAHPVVLVYEFVEEGAVAVVRIILHQLWVPVQQVLFVVALARALDEVVSKQQVESKDSGAVQEVEPKDLVRAALSIALAKLPKSLTTQNGERAGNKGAAKNEQAVFWAMRSFLVPGNNRTIPKSDVHRAMAGEELGGQR